MDTGAKLEKIKNTRREEKERNMRGLRVLLFIRERKKGKEVCFFLIYILMYVLI